jgi:hypothetical protein
MGTSATAPPLLRADGNAAPANPAMDAGSAPDQAVDAQAGNRAAVLAPAPQESASAAARHPDNDKARELVLAAQRQQQFGQQLTSFLDELGHSDPTAVNATLETRFYSEERNREWASEREGDIRTLFEANENLRGMTPTQVACRSKNCQVVLPASTQDQVRALTERFMEAATRGDVGMQDQVVSYFPDISAGRVVFYLSENGNTDLFR